MRYYQICRFCKKAGYETPREGMVRYSIRHWCHVSCGIARWGIEAFLAKLTPVQIAGLPAAALTKHVGTIEQALAKIPKA